MTTTATSEHRLRLVDGTVEITLTVPPVPAARPRVSKFGTYYPKTYKNWMLAAAQALQEIENDNLVREGGSIFEAKVPLFIASSSVVARPKNPANRYPRGDVDNYGKAIIDAVVKAGWVMPDDDSVIWNVNTKRYAMDGEEPHSFIKIATSIEPWMDDDGTGRDVYDLPPEYRVRLEEVLDDPDED